jgi:cob(I)alamin adenosyltransferase
MSRIYTKTGDEGTTEVFGKRLSKGNKLAEVLGSIDELNSWMGVCRTECKMYNVKFTILDIELRRIQKNLMTIASDLAGGGKRLSNGETKRLEKIIDKLTEEMPVLRNFIYPTGYLQMARAMARHAEREIVRYTYNNLRDTDKTILKYMNRLSDALFVMARWVNFKSDTKEEIWGK